MIVPNQSLQPVAILETTNASIKYPCNRSQYGRFTRSVHARKDVWPDVGLAVPVG